MSTFTIYSHEPADLVPGRKCGECTVCCSVLAIKDVDLKKLAGVLCPNCADGSGCTIYSLRPKSCRDFYCGWLTYEALDESWRPDRCGILLTTEESDIPARFGSRPGVSFLLFGSWRAVLQPGLHDFIADLVRRDIPAFLSIPGPEGYHPAKTFLNDAMRDAAIAGEPQAMIDCLMDALELLSKYEFRPNAF